MGSFVAVSLLSLNAFADEPPGPPPPPPYAPAPAPGYAPGAYVAQQARPTPDRNGFTIGFALGGGQLKLDNETVEADSSVGISLRAGVALSQRFLLQGTLEGTRAQARDGQALQLNFAGISATAYVHPRIYLSGGLGYAGLEVLDADNEVIGSTEDSAALLLGAGFEVYQSSGFALSVELRGFAAEFGGETASGGNVLLGFQWF